MRTPDGRFRQRLISDVDREGFHIWVCYGCGARVVESVMIHNLDCPEVAEPAPVELRTAYDDPKALAEGGYDDPGHPHGYWEAGDY